MLQCRSPRPAREAGRRNANGFHIKEHVVNQSLLMTAAAVGLVATHVSARDAHAEDTASARSLSPIVFQAAGPDAASIQGTVDAFRAALGEPNNGNDPGPLESGRREINWDGGGSDSTTAPETPFEGFLDSRGGLFTTPGDGLTQAPASGGPEGGLAVLFDNPTYATAFTAFSPVRLFTPVGSNWTEASFFVPGTQGSAPATVSSFGAIFGDVDDQDSGDRRRAGASIEFYGADDTLLFESIVPASAGTGSLSFFGVHFDDARIARVRIRTGDVPAGPNDSRRHDIVVMDDFIYGEPQMQ
jgi:hypothetical protein